LAWRNKKSLLIAVLPVRRPVADKGHIARATAAQSFKGRRNAMAQTLSLTAKNHWHFTELQLVAAAG
jgi:hypothetical protein